MNYHISNIDAVRRLNGGSVFSMLVGYLKLILIITLIAVEFSIFWVYNIIGFFVLFFITIKMRLFILS